MDGQFDRAEFFTTFAELLILLANAGVSIPDDLGGVGTTPPDDVIDAAAAAWSAVRIANGAVPG